MNNAYIPFVSTIVDVIKHTEIEYTFRLTYSGDAKPGQFFEVSIPKFGEAPISISGIEEGIVDLTIRKVGKVTNEIFEHYIGDTLMIRGPYGNGFDVLDYTGGELLVVAGGTGVSPVRGVIEYFSNNQDNITSMNLIAGFKSENDMLFKADFKKWQNTMNTIVTLDNGSNNPIFKEGLVTAHIPTLTINDYSSAKAIVVGPPIMMQFAVKALLEKGFLEHNIWISQERKMCCGLGKCGHCRINDKYICIDGPVFNYKIGKELID